MSSCLWSPYLSFLLLWSILCSGDVVYWLTWEFEGFVKPGKQQRPLETCKIHYLFLDFFGVCPLLSINSLQTKQIKTNVKHKPSYSQEKSKQNRLMSSEGLRTSINLGLHWAKGQSPTGKSDRLDKVLAKFCFPLQGIIQLWEGWAST